MRPQARASAPRVAQTPPGEPSHARQRFLKVHLRCKAGTAGSRRKQRGSAGQKRDTLNMASRNQGLDVSESKQTRQMGRNSCPLPRGLHTHPVSPECALLSGEAAVLPATLARVRGTASPAPPGSCRATGICDPKVTTQMRGRGPGHTDQKGASRQPEPWKGSLALALYSQSLEPRPSNCS